MTGNVSTVGKVGGVILGVGLWLVVLSWLYIVVNLVYNLVRFL